MICRQCNKTCNNPKFCSSKCAAIYNNKRRTSESRIKQRITLCNTLGISPNKQKNKTKNPIISALKNNIPFTKIKQCTYCKQWFNSEIRGNTTTCSDACYINIKTKLNRNGKKQIYNGVHFDSSWEVMIATSLDSSKILWDRPEHHLPWFDSTGKQRKYFPDFYLPEYNIYLDPKNKYAHKQQKEKISYFKKHNNVVIGDLSDIMTLINALHLNSQRIF